MLLVGVSIVEGGDGETREGGSGGFAVLLRHISFSSSLIVRPETDEISEVF